MRYSCRYIKRSVYLSAPISLRKKEDISQLNLLSAAFIIG